MLVPSEFEQNEHGKRPAVSAGNILEDFDSRPRFLNKLQDVRPCEWIKWVVVGFVANLLHLHELTGEVSDSLWEMRVQDWLSWTLGAFPFDLSVV